MDLLPYKIIAIKKRPKNPKLLRRVKQNPRYHSNCAKVRRLQAPTSPIPVTGAPGRTLGNLQPSGSEVMGLMAAGCRFAPNSDSLKTCKPNRLRHSLFHIANTLSCAPKKVKCFSQKERANIQFSGKVTKQPCIRLPKIGKLPVDKRGCLWLNYRNAYLKDKDGKFAFYGCSREPAVGASRCGSSRQSDSRVGSVNAPVGVSNGTRLPPLPGWDLLESESDFP